MGIQLDIMRRVIRGSCQASEHASFHRLRGLTYPGGITMTVENELT
jgi:hypothetical protein